METDVEIGSSVAAESVVSERLSLYFCVSSLVDVRHSIRL